MEAEREDAAGAGVMHEDGGDFVELCFVSFDVLLRANQTFFFTAEQNKANSALGLEIQLSESARGLEHGDGAGAVIGSAGAEIPGVQVSAKDHDFIGLLASAELCHGVIDLDRLAAEGILHFDFHLHGPVFLHAIEHAVAFAGDEGGGNKALGERLGADVGHVQQAVGFIGIAEDGGNALGFEELIAESGQFLELNERRRRGRFALEGRRSLHGTQDSAVLDIGTRRRKTRWLAHDDDGALELAAVLLEVFFFADLDEHDRAANLALGARRPSRRSDRQRMLSRGDDAGRSGAARPGMRNGPGFEVDVGETVLAEHLGGPVVCLLEPIGAGEARTDVVREIFEILHGFAVIANLAQDLRIDSSKAPCIVRRARVPEPDASEQQQRRTHEKSHST